MIRFLSGCLILTWVGVGVGWASSAPAPTLQTTQVKKETTNPKSYSVLLGVEHYQGFRSDQDGVTEWYVDASYRFGQKHRLRLVQGVSQNYAVDEIGGRSFEMNDTSLYHYYSVAKDLRGFNLTVRAGATIPASIASRQKSLRTKPNVSFYVSRSFFNKALKVTYGPSVSYYWNRYSTSVDGSPLRRWSVGNSLSASYSPIKKLSLVAAIAGAYHFKEPSPWASRGGPKTGAYEIDLSASYQWTKLLSTTLGFYQSDALFKSGRYEMNFYDVLSSRFYVGLGATI